MNTSVLIGIPCLKTGGTEMQTLRLVEALASGGYHCVTVCYFEYEFQMVQAFERAGSRVVCLSAYGRRPEGNRAVYKFLKTGLKRVVDEYRPKIAHIQYMAPGAMPIIILKKLGISTIVATLHTNADIYKSLGLLHLIQRRVVNAFTCVSENAEKSFFGSSQLFDNNYTLKKRNHFTIPNCLAPEAQPAASVGQLPANVIGIVARLENIKGADLVMPAFSKVLEKKNDCSLLIVGDGKERAKMESQMTDLKIDSSRVEWAGQVDHSKLADYYRQMTLVWIPSRSEGFGLTAIEAMAQGRTVVASATGGLNDIVNDGNNGLLFCNGDANELALRTVELFDDPDRLLNLSASALQASQQYTFENYRTAILSMYEKLKNIK